MVFALELFNWEGRFQVLRGIAPLGTGGRGVPEKSRKKKRPRTKKGFSGKETKRRGKKEGMGDLQPPQGK